MGHFKLQRIHALALIFLVFACTAQAVYALNPTDDLRANYLEATDTTIFDAADFGIQSSGFPVACRIGTLHICRVSGNNVMIGLSLQRSGRWNYGNEYKLISTETINWQEQFGAQIVAKITCGTHPTRIQLINWQSGQDPFIDSETMLESGDMPVHVEFYLGIRNITNALQVQGVGFQFQGVGGHNLGDFQVISRRRVPTDPWNYSYYQEAVPINLLNDPIPFYSVNYNKKSTYYLNLGSGRTVYANFSIEEIAPSGQFDLLRLLDTPLVPIARARFTLTGYQSNNSYGINLVCTDAQGSSYSSFAMKHEDTDEYIPFELYLGADEVHKGVSMEWSDLHFGCDNTKDFQVGGISLTDVENKVSGNYADTITVQITPLDTNVIVQQ